MGACFHIAGTTCDNCRPLGMPSGSAGATLSWNPVRTPETLPYATTTEVAALTARFAALEAEVARLTEKLTPKVSSPVSCPSCKSTDVQRLPWILTSEPPQQPWACRTCNHRWNTRC